MSERLTWKEIEEKYPDQWIGIVEVEWEPDNDASVKTAIVKYVGRTKNDLTLEQVKTDGAMQAVYTTPDNLCPLGAVGYFG